MPTGQPAFLTGAQGAAVADLVAAVRQLEGLTGQVGPYALPAETRDRAPELVAAVCRELGVPLTFDARPEGRTRDFAAIALGAEIQRAQRAPELAGLDVAVAAAEARRVYDEETAGYRPHRVTRPDGSVITAVEAGPPDAPCVLLSPPCAMDHRLSLPWLVALRSRYRCVIVESRGGIEPAEEPAAFDRRGHDLADQADDLLAVIEALDTGPVHLMGLCGGVGAALAAAARSDRVRSVSLWHAAVDLGAEARQTEHQVNLREMLEMAGESRDSAAWLRDRLTSGPMTGVPERVGPLVVRPYATAELFYRYARLTSASIRWDSRASAAGLTQPCLVITSADDRIAHPDGSRRLAELIPSALLVVSPHGHHLDAFRATADQVSCLTSFLTS